MHKRIDIEQVELGMFIHKMEGSWLNHPFWRAQFLLDDRAKLQKLRESGVPAVIIDVSRGRDVGSPANDEAGAAEDVAGDVAGDVAEVVVVAPEPAPALPADEGRPLTAAERLARRPRTRMPPKIPAHAIQDVGNLRRAAPQSLAREFGQAAAVHERSKKVISRAFLKIRLGKGFKASMVEPVIEDIFASVERNAHAFNGLMQCKQDNETLYRHALATSALMISLGRRLRLPNDMLRHAGMTGLMLDVGLAQLPVDLAAIENDYTRLPQNVYEAHVDLGLQLCMNGDIPEPVAIAIGEHHERVDGGGYPLGLRRADLSLLGRMAAICDAYDNMTNGPAGKSIDPAAAIARMGAETGAYDAELFAAFTEAMGIYPIGATLLLHSGRLAMVVDQNAEDPTTPRVVTFFSAISGHKIAPEVIDLAACETDAIDQIAAPEAFGIADFPALREKLFIHACMS
ncbi:MAG: DUF3391 domain-containing protein [Sphingomonadales bacterium]|nr:DUF3391 domain-containing protein [Sphingomonadales bacterium]